MSTPITRSLDAQLSESHRQVRAACRRFAETEIVPHVVEWEEAECFPDELFEKAAAAGILGMSFPPHCCMDGASCRASNGVLRGRRRESQRALRVVPCEAM